MQAKDIMSQPVVTVKKHDTLSVVAVKLEEYNISGMPVVDDNNRVVGIISEFDLIKISDELDLGSGRYPFGSLSADMSLESVAYLCRGLSTMSSARVEEIMTRDVVTVESNTPLEQVARLMVKRRINRMPVLEDGKLVGIITRNNLLKGLVDQL